jgi:hypothetical protein
VVVRGGHQRQCQRPPNFKQLCQVQRLTHNDRLYQYSVGANTQLSYTLSVIYPALPEDHDKHPFSQATQTCISGSSVKT